MGLPCRRSCAQRWTVPCYSLQLSNGSSSTEERLKSLTLWDCPQAEERAALKGALLQLAAFHWHTGSVERARGLAERAQRQSQQPTAAATLLAWVILSSPAEDGAAGQQVDLREAEGLLGKALQLDPSNLEVCWGLHMKI